MASHFTCWYFMLMLPVIRLLVLVLLLLMPQFPMLRLVQVRGEVLAGERQPDVQARSKPSGHRVSKRVGYLVRWSVGWWFR